MSEHDVVVVGARLAGSTLAACLVRDERSGRFTYRARGHHPWQGWPGGDLADELGPTVDEQARHFATTA